jgi:hypothetical protein
MAARVGRSSLLLLQRRSEACIAKVRHREMDVNNFHVSRPSIKAARIVYLRHRLGGHKRKGVCSCAFPDISSIE